MRRNTENNILSMLSGSKTKINENHVKAVVELKILNETQKRRINTLRRKSHTVELAPLTYAMADKINAQEHVKIRKHLENSFTLEL